MSKDKPKGKAKKPAIIPRYQFDVVRLNVPFKFGDISRMIDILDTAAGVRPARQDAHGTLQLWKMACGLNSDRLTNYLQSKGEEATNVLLAEVDQADWAEVRRKVVHAYRDCYEAWQGNREADNAPPEVMPDWVPDIMVAGTMEDLLDECGDAVFAESLFGLYEASRSQIDDKTAKARKTALDKVADILEPERLHVVSLVGVKWDRAPTRLHGGYLRELLWMFDPVPAVVREMVEIYSSNTETPCEPETT